VYAPELFCEVENTFENLLLHDRNGAFSSCVGWSERETRQWLMFQKLRNIDILKNSSIQSLPREAGKGKRREGQKQRYNVSNTYIRTCHQRGIKITRHSLRAKLYSADVRLRQATACNFRASLVYMFSASPSAC